MEPISSFKGYIESMRWHNSKQENFISCILFVNPNDTNNIIVREILSNLETYHVFSGKNMTFFMPGYTEDIVLFDQHREFDRVDFSRRNFSLENFRRFVQDLERISTWRYSLQTDMLFLNMVNNELDFSYVYNYQLETLMHDGEIPNVNTLFNELRLAVEETESLQLEERFMKKALEGLAKCFLSKFKNWRKLIKSAQYRPHDYTK